MENYCFGTVDDGILLIINNERNNNQVLRILKLTKYCFEFNQYIGENDFNLENFNKTWPNMKLYPLL